MHPTLEKFGYPKTLIRDYEHWAVVLRPAQVTIGSLVLSHRGREGRFSELPAAAFTELQEVIADIENTLRAVFDYQKINYLMLMMSDPQVHFHVIPRYSEPVTLGDATFADAGWPGQPRLDEVAELDEAQSTVVLERLRAAWPR